MKAKATCSNFRVSFISVEKTSSIRLFSELLLLELELVLMRYGLIYDVKKLLTL